MASIVQLLVSPEHRYAGRPGPVELVDDTVPELRLRAGLGIVGDRYFNKPAHRDASVTVVAAEELDSWNADLRATRRNVLLRGVPLELERGAVLELDSGDGPVLLQVHRPAHPCRWLDVTVSDGAWRGLRGRAGWRCSPLTDGVLRVGPVTVSRT